MPVCSDIFVHQLFNLDPLLGVPNLQFLPPSSSSHTGDIPALPHTLALSTETRNKKKRKSYTFETKQAVYDAVKTGGLKYADAAAQFGIAGGKSAVQNIVKGGPYETFIGFKRQRKVPSSVFEIETKLVDQAIILRNRHLPVSRLVIMQNFATLPMYSSNILSQIMQIIGELVKRDIQSRPDLPEDEFTFLQTFDVGEKFFAVSLSAGS